MSTKSKKLFTASDTALAINSITRMHEDDLQALLEVIADYFDEDEREAEIDDEAPEPSFQKTSGGDASGLVSSSDAESDSEEEVNTTPLTHAESQARKEAGTTSDPHTESQEDIVHCDLTYMVTLEIMEHTEGEHAHTLTLCLTSGTKKIQCFTS